MVGVDREAIGDRTLGKSGKYARDLPQKEEDAISHL